MNDTTVVAGAFTLVSGLLAWLVKAVIGEYHKRLDRHDQFMDGLVARNTASQAEVAAKMAETSVTMSRLVDAVEHNSEIARCCEEVGSARIKQRMQKAQAEGRALSEAAMQEP